MEMNLKILHIISSVERFYFFNFQGCRAPKICVYKSSVCLSDFYMFRHQTHWRERYGSDILNASCFHFSRICFEVILVKWVKCTQHSCFSSKTKNSILDFLLFCEIARRTITPCHFCTLDEHDLFGRNLIEKENVRGSPPASLTLVLPTVWWRNPMHCWLLDSEQLGKFRHAEVKWGFCDMFGEHV